MASSARVTGQNTVVMTQDPDILDNISTGVVALDDQLCVTALNASGQAILETSELRCIGTHARNLVLRSREWLDNLEQVLAMDPDNAYLQSRLEKLRLAAGQPAAAPPAPALEAMSEEERTAWGQAQAWLSPDNCR